MTENLYARVKLQTDCRCADGQVDELKGKVSAESVRGQSGGGRGGGGGGGKAISGIVYVSCAKGGNRVSEALNCRQQGIEDVWNYPASSAVWGLRRVRPGRRSGNFFLGQTLEISPRGCGRTFREGMSMTDKKT